MSNLDPGAVSRRLYLLLKCNPHLQLLDLQQQTCSMFHNVISMYVFQAEGNLGNVPPSETENFVQVISNQHFSEL